MLEAITRLFTDIIMAFAPDIIRLVRSSSSDSQALIRIRSLLKRRASEALHDEIVKRLR